jgi:putative hydrolase of HD superfamily
MKELAHLLYEMGLLKRIRRSGWWVAGIDDPESVAEHVFRTAALGYLLATLEGADPERTAAICLFHDVPEARIGDLHRVNQGYLETREAEGRAFSHQMERLPAPLAERLGSLFRDWQTEGSLEARVARDADVLECLIQAREYQSQGCSSVTDWIHNAYSQLRTSSARSLADTCMETDPKEWWHRLAQKGADGKTEWGGA